MARNGANVNINNKNDKSEYKPLFLYHGSTPRRPAPAKPKTNAFQPRNRGHSLPRGWGIWPGGCWGRLRDSTPARHHTEMTRKQRSESSTIIPQTRIVTRPIVLALMVLINLEYINVISIRSGGYLRGFCVCVCLCVRLRVKAMAVMR